MKFWVLTPIVALDTAVAGALAIYYGELALSEVVGEDSLSVPVLLLAGAIFTPVVALVAGSLVGVERRADTPRAAVAMRRGFVVAGWCLLAYLLASAIVWWPAG